MRWLKNVKNRRLIRSVLFACLMLLVFSLSRGQSASVLATGDWYKLAIVKTGVHRVDFAMLREMGLNPSEILPEQLQIFGNGGAMLPQANSSPRISDLKENAIWVTGEQDGRFDSNDALYFYAEGPVSISYDSLRNNLIHEINIYSDTTYYFLTVGKSKGLRIRAKESLNKKSQSTRSQFDDYWFHEQESYNLLHSGRDWWGEYLGGSTALTIPLPLSGIVAGSDIVVLTSGVAASYQPSRFLWQLAGKNVGETAVSAVPQYQYDLKGIYDLKGVKADSRFVLKADGTQLSSVAVSYDKGGQNGAQAYLNYIALQVKRELKPYEVQQTYYFVPSLQDTVSYQVKDVPAEWQWWDVTSRMEPAVVRPGVDGIYTQLGGRSLMQFVGFVPGQAFKPASWTKISNQNIRQNAVPDLLIISPSAWASEARRLATYRKQHDKLDALVLTMDEISNEFSSGKMDVTALRDCIRYFYLRDAGKLKYVLLFGDATYDYRNVLKNQPAMTMQSWVPVYESRESLNPISTYSSDDYLGFMEEHEGIWRETASGDHSQELGIGRFPVKMPEEARVVVDKLINYDAKLSFGSWKNQVRLVADDGDGGIHQKDADELARMIQPRLLPERIFLDAFQQTTTPLGQKVPEVNAAIKKSINSGSLILNYTGHGGISGWAEEQVLTIAEMQTARGNNNLPLLVTATCDFGRFDDPGIVSGGELMVMSPRGAAIGALSTTRPVFSSANLTLNRAFYQAVLDLLPNARMGDIVRQTKNKGLDMERGLNRNFTLLGDPSMRLGSGQRKIQWSVTPDTLRALKNIKLSGAVLDENGTQPDGQFSGSARVTIYDKPTTFKTFGTENVEVKEYSELRNKLFEGQVTVLQGRFVCEFIVPKDIDYRVGTGRASVYAVRADSLLDAAGQLDLVVGGSEEAGVDREPPKLTAYMNSASFKTGDLIPASSVLFVKVSDESGINLSGAGIGHDVSVTLNDTVRIVLNNYYLAENDSFKNGTITYPFENLPSGNYTIRIKVWDVHNNSSEISFGFQVGPSKGIQLVTAKVYPNPFDQEFSFEINHDRGDEDVEILFNVYLKTGRQILTFKRQYYNSEPVIKETISSSLLNSMGTPSYEYVFSLQIRSLKDNSTNQKVGKLVRLP
jgi:hypothetical protein